MSFSLSYNLAVTKEFFPALMRCAIWQEVMNANSIIVILRLVLQRDMVLKEHSILTLCNLCIIAF